MSCSVVGCKSIYNPFCVVSLHRITKNKKYLPLWEQVVKIRKNVRQPKICSLHFTAKDFIKGVDRRILKPHAVPSVNIIEKDYSDDEEDNKNLSTLKRTLTAYDTESSSESTERTAHVDQSDTNAPEHIEMIMPCCNSVQLSNYNAKQTSNVGIQTYIKSDKEISLQARVKLLELRLRRRDAKISYMRTVLNMIKKHTKGTDVAYRLCCELQNMSESEPINNNGKRGKKECDLSLINERVETPASANEDVKSSEDEAGTFVEVVHSPNLTTCSVFSH